MKVIQTMREKMTLHGVQFPRNREVELPADWPFFETSVENLEAWGFTIIHDPTPNLRPKDDPDTTPILVDGKAVPPPGIKEHKIETPPPVLHEADSTEPPPPVAESKTDMPLEFHRNPAVVNRKAKP